MAQPIPCPIVLAAAHSPLIPELEDALRQVSADQQAETVRRVTDLFVSGAGGFNELHIRLFDRILSRLIAASDTPALVELARRLAPIRNAPPDVIRRLAGDDAITVAGPVLARSVLLDDADLVAIAGSKSQAHLFVISGRSDLSEAVTDILVQRGDRDVVRNTAMNHRARISRVGRTMLAQRAAHDAILAEKLARREDMAPEVSRSLAAELDLSCAETPDSTACGRRAAPLPRSEWRRNPAMECANRRHAPPSM